MVVSEIGSAYVTILPSFKGGSAALAREMDGSLEAAGKSGGQKFGGALLGSVKTMAGGFAAAFAADKIVGGIMDSINAASDLSETVNKSNVIFGAGAGAMEAWASTAASTMGLSKQAALEAGASFGDMFSQIGFASGDAAKMSQSVVQLAADLGSFNNLPTAEVTDMIAASFRGEYDSLQRVIPNINAARVETEALAATGKRSAKELTAQEKAAATLAIVQKDGARAMGDFARTSDGVANKQKILAARMEDAKAKFGELLLPVKSLVLDGFLRLMDIGGQLGPVFSTISTAVGPLASSVAGFFASLAGAGESAGQLGAISAAVGGLVAIVVQFGSVAFGIFSDFASQVATQLAPLAPTVQAAFQTVVDIVVGVMGIVQQVVSIALGVIQFVWSSWGTQIVGVVTSVASGFVSIISAGLDLVRAIVTTVLAVVRGDWSGAWDGMTGILSGAWEVIKAVVSAAVGIVRSVISLAWEMVKTATTSAFGMLVSAISGKLGEAVELVRGLPGRAVAALGNVGGLLAQAGRDLIEGFIGGIRDMAGRVAGAVGGVVSGAIDKAKSLLGISSPSRVFRVMGQQTGEGYSLGVDSTQDDVRKSYEKLLRIPDTAALTARTSRPTRFVFEGATAANGAGVTVQVLGDVWGKPSDYIDQLMAGVDEALTLSRLRDAVQA